MICFKFVCHAAGRLLKLGTFHVYTSVLTLYCRVQRDNIQKSAIEACRIGRFIFQKNV